MALADRQKPEACGIVQRVKFLKRPGHDLDKIAVEHAFGLRFDPARDKHGYPKLTWGFWVGMPAWLPALFTVAWPLYHWRAGRSARQHTRP